MSALLELAEHYYAVAHDLIAQGERAIETGKYLGAMADRMCEQNMRETDPKPEPAQEDCPAQDGILMSAQEEP